MRKPFLSFWMYSQPVSALSTMIIFMQLSCTVGMRYNHQFPAVDQVSQLPEAAGIVRRVQRVNWMLFKRLLLLSILTSTSFGCQHDQHCSSSVRSDIKGANRMKNWLRFVQKTSDVVILSEESTSSTGPDGLRLINTTSTVPYNLGAVSKPTRVLVVSQDGSGDHRRIQEAVDAAPNWCRRRTIIHIKGAVYREKIVIPKQKRHLCLIGEKGRTIIEWNSKASDTGHNGKQLGTLRSATVAVSAEYFVAKDLIFQNTAPAPTPGNRSEGAQAVALRISADKAAFYDCQFVGHQDTLYDHKGRHYFRNCHIEGSVDFIFGSGRSLYQGCHLYASTKGAGFVTAQKKSSASLNSGFSFVNSTIRGSGAIYLGRAWGKDSRVVFSYTFMDDIIVPEGWSDWGIPAREKSVFYAEYKCYGPGADRSRRVRWSKSLTAEEARPFLTIGFINGEQWLEEL